MSFYDERVLLPCRYLKRYMIFPTYHRERALFAQGVSAVAGCDEVGRGCLAGPVVAAAVVLPGKLPRGWKGLLRDSKTLSRLQRMKADTWIREHALRFGVGVVDVATIDRINILQASFQAMREALKGFADVHVLVDGKLRIPGVPWEQTAIVDGDASCASIAAASILAKEYRDQLMEDVDREFPQYGFTQHKGYGTPQHRAAILAHGMTEHHRKTFCHFV